MRALITGIGGFVGGHLATLLRQEGAEVWGIDCRPLSGHVADRGITMLLGDLCDREFARCAVRDAKPTHVFHLAWEFADNLARGADADRRNLEGLRLLLEAVHESAPAARVLVTSSSAVYGASARHPSEAQAAAQPPTSYAALVQPLASHGDSRVEADPAGVVSIGITEDAPLAPTTAYGLSTDPAGVVSVGITEETTLAPTTAYGVSPDPEGVVSVGITEHAPLAPRTAYGVNKAAAETAARSFRSLLGLDIVVTRTFNALGPGMPQRLFAGSLAAQIAAAERGGPSTIKVGRLDSSRDYVDVRDAARAFIAIATRPALESTVFNVCTGVARTGNELAEEMLAHATVPVTLDHDVSRLQTGDIDVQQGCADRLRLATGWTPTISFSTSVCDTLDYERGRVRK